MILFGDCRDKYCYDIFRYIAENSIDEIKYIIFPKNNNDKDIKKIVRLFRYNIDYFKESFPHKSKKIISSIKKNKIKVALCVSFPNRIRNNFLKLFEQGVFNAHPGLIQFYRGRHSAFWAIYNDYNFGCTLHTMNEKFDHGLIYDQIIIKNNGIESANTAHILSNLARLKIIKKNFKKILHNSIKPNLKLKSKGKYYSKNDIQKKINLKKNGKLNVKDFWNIIRGTSIANSGFFINIEKQKYKIVSKIIKVK